MEYSYPNTGPRFVGTKIDPDNHQGLLGIDHQIKATWICCFGKDKSKLDRKYKGYIISDCCCIYHENN